VLVVTVLPMCQHQPFTIGNKDL